MQLRNDFWFALFLTFGVGHALVVPMKNQFDGSLNRYQCSETVADKQLQRWIQRDKEWWSHSACPAQYWLEKLGDVFKAQGKQDLTLVDVGCNKGYTSAKFFDAFSPAGGLHPKSLYKVIDFVNKKQEKPGDRICGACSDCQEAPSTKTINLFNNVSVHCFEPSPISMSFLKEVVDNIKIPKYQNWVLHENGVSEKDGKLWWSGCSKTGDELCHIAEEGTADAVPIDVVTIDKFAASGGHTIDLLKIDAEGHDPAVLKGAEQVLSSGKTPVVTFEYNPRVGGLWKSHDLMEVTKKLDKFGYDCYFESNQKDHGNSLLIDHTPSLYLITGDCMPKIASKKFRGWSNVVCALRKDPQVSTMFRKLATLL